jgi:hypothetical protein
MPTRERSFQPDGVTIDAVGQVVEIIWPPSTTREVKTIFSVTSTRIYLYITKSFHYSFPWKRGKNP